MLDGLTVEDLGFRVKGLKAQGSRFRGLGFGLEARI